MDCRGFRVCGSECRIEQGSREQMYSIFGPLSLLMLLVALGSAAESRGFRLIYYYGLGSPFGDAFNQHPGTGGPNLRSDMYVSGTTLFTLGLGDVVPPELPYGAGDWWSWRAGTGLVFLALVIGYVPVLYHGVLAPGGERGDAGWPRRLAADSDGDPACGTRMRVARSRVDRVAGGVGALVGGDIGIAHLVSTAVLLPVAAR